MIAKDYVVLPTEGEVRGQGVAIVDEGKSVAVYIDRHEVSVPSVSFDDEAGGQPRMAAPLEGEDVTQMVGYMIRCAKPATRAMIINAAEMQAYGLVSAMDSASLNASLARKARANAMDPEVLEHDEFIDWVKRGLDEIGV